MELYLNEVIKNRIIPNFWCSEEYLKLSEAVEKTWGNWVWIEDSRTNDILFPVIDLEKGIITKTPDDRSVWSDFSGYNPFHYCSGKDWKANKLDLEFVYKPKKFNNLSGGHWKKFRKNIKKWPKRNGVYQYIILNPKTAKALDSDIKDLSLKWMEKIGLDNIHDGDTLVKFCTQGSNRAVLAEENKGIVGMNIWDHSPLPYCINFRYTITLPGEGFLDEFLRYLFYTHYKIEPYYKYVNDGGCLDSPGLENFKKRLNPHTIRTVNGWSKL